jgi:hypothetical protein
VSPWTWLAGTYFRASTNIIENDPIFGVTDTFKQFGFDIADPDLLPDARPGQFPNDNSFAGAFHYRESRPRSSAN